MRAREVSPVEVLEAHLRRAGQINSRLNAIVTFADDAPDRAREAEQLIMRDDRVPLLCGLPLTIKDTIDVRGLRSTAGTLVRAEHVPMRDAPAIARLRAAGAIIFGKTNASELALDYTTDNPVFGRTNNPHDLSMTPGGSSGGCAAAVSACLSPASIGSDLAGSVRLPAHFCGISALLPTAGIIPNAGHFPTPEGPLAQHETFGPLTRRVEDLELLFRVLADRNSSSTDFPASTLSRSVEDNSLLRGWRVAWYTDDGIAPVTDETKQAVETAARALNDAGLVCTNQMPPHVERGDDLWLALFSRAVQNSICEIYAGRETLAGPVARAMIERAGNAPNVSLDQYLNTWVERDRLRAALLEWMETTPLILAPVGSVAAFAHDARKVSVGKQLINTFRSFSYSQTFNVFGLPAVAVPAGRTLEGLPIGVQIVGRPHDESNVLAAAQIIEDALGGWQPPPPQGFSSN